MPVDLTTRATQLIDAENRRDERVVALARLLSIAVQIEPELVRTIRLKLLPHADAGVEADLWFGPLVAARDPGGLSFLPDVAELLRRQLAEPRYQAQRADARQLITSLHAGHSPMLRLEEAATYFSVDGDYRRMEEELGRAFAALDRSSDDVIARWVARTLPRMPEAVRSSEPAIALARRTAQRLGGVRVRGVIEADEPGADWDVQLLTRLPRVRVGLRLTSAGLEISHPPSTDVVNGIEVPHTDPLVLEIATPAMDGLRSQRVTWKPNTTTTVAVNLGPQLTLTTATGDSQTLRVDTLGRAPTLYAPGAGSAHDVIAREADALGWWVCWSFPELLARAGEPEADAYLPGPDATNSDTLTQPSPVNISSFEDHTRLAVELRSALIAHDVLRASVWIDQRVAAGKAPDAQRRDFRATPYPGLRSFEVDEAPIFFGRSRQIEAMRDILFRTRRLLVSGKNGVGRASLLRAGFLASLQPGFPDRGTRWVPLLLRPAGPFVDETVRALSSLSPDTNLVVVLDQFEEIFRRPGLAGAQETWDQFQHVVDRGPQNVYVVVSVRSDFLPDVLKLDRFASYFEASQFEVPALTRSGMRDAIVQPARSVDGEVEEALVGGLLEVIEGERDSLPLLQYTLSRIWTLARERSLEHPRMTVELYESIAGIGAIQVDAEEAFGELPPEAQLIAERMFRRLTEVTERTPATLADIAAITGAPPQRLAVVVDAFRRRHFVLPPSEVPLTAETMLDIVHPLLIRKWERLHEWTIDESKMAAIYRDLLGMLPRWQSDPAAVTWSSNFRMNVREWQESNPNAAWAERYGGRFDAVTAFVAGMTERQRGEPHARPTFDYTYYVSYAHQDRDDALTRLLDRLRDEVRKRTGEDPDRVEFRDSASRQATSLPAVLGSVLQRSAVMLSIVSPAYFGSTWTGREVQFVDQYRGGLKGAVVPLVWQPVGEMPGVFSELAAFELPDSYRSAATRVLGAQSRREREFASLIANLAGTIVDLAARARKLATVSDPAPDFQNIGSAWESVQPNPFTGFRPSGADAASFVEQAEVPPQRPPASRGTGSRGSVPFDAHRHQAAVVGADIICFLPHLSAALRQDIVNASLLAQLVAKKKVDPDSAETAAQWSREYLDVLSKVGFAVQESGTSEYSSTVDAYAAHEAVREVAGRVFSRSPEALRVVNHAIGSLAQMPDDSPWLTVFNRESHRRSLTRFRILLADSESQGLSLSLLTFSLTSNSTITQVLFFRIQKGDSQLRYETARMAINEQILLAVRDAMARKVERFQLDFVAGLDDDSRLA
jgi:hypothetical protein